MAQIMGEIEDPTHVRGDLPLALAIAGRQEQAVHWIRANLRDYPENAWIHVHAGDAYEELKDYPNALASFHKALKLTADADDWDCFRDRMMNILTELGQE